MVGAGRIVDNLSGPLVSVGSTGTEAQILVDTDLTNIFTPGSIVGAEALTNQLVSIRDLNYVYDGGQKPDLYVRTKRMAYWILVS